VGSKDPLTHRCLAGTPPHVRLRGTGNPRLLVDGLGMFRLTEHPPVPQATTEAYGHLLYSFCVA
jgi:hypothetical protein